MFRAALIAILLFSVLTGVFAQTEPQDYTSQLLKLATLTDSQQYREAIEGYRLLRRQPGTPGWLKAACEFETAELYAALHDTDRAVSALGGAVRLGFDDCLAPRASERLRTILQEPKATQTLAEMKIAEANFRELVWLKAEAQHARHDGRMMILENTNRLDHDATAIPQAQLPTRPTTSAAVLYWRQQLLLRQRIQREFVMRADMERIRHATRMAIITGRVSSSALLESARRARAAAESRRLEIRRRSFTLATPLPDRLRSCSEWSLGTPPAPNR
jgi:hypothetical protein